MRRLAFPAIIVAFFGFALEATSQAPPFSGGDAVLDPLQGFLPSQETPLPGGGGPDGPHVGKIFLSADFELVEGSREGRLSVTALLKDGWHTYSLTQPAGATQRSSLDVAKNEKFEITGSFTPNPAPHVAEYEYYAVPVEEHEKSVTWTAPIRLAKNVSPEELTIEVVYQGQICSTAPGEGCIPVPATPARARFRGHYAADESAAEPVTPAGEYRETRFPSPVKIRGYLTPSVIAPGEKATLVLTAVPEDDDFHVYKQAAVRGKESHQNYTLILVDAPDKWTSGSPASQAETKEIVTEKGKSPMPYYVGEVTWTIPVDVPKDASPGAYSVSGSIAYQTCSANSCNKPTAADFRATINVGDQTAAGTQQPLEFSPSDYGDVAKRAAVRHGDLAGGYDPSKAVKADDELSAMPILAVLGLAFLGGLLLNFMPCVLPVIGLKAMGFMNQAGENRAKIFSLNACYSSGLIATWLVFATISVILYLLFDRFLRSGELFTYPAFNIAMAGVIFAMSLSFLGVWEIPIPGFIGGSRKANALAAKEGPVGAFAMGVLTTVLATPCIGPYMGSAITWSVKQPPLYQYLIYFTIGLGMASPFLAIGLNPVLLRFLPKPGAWMDTFKQIMGFIMLAALVWVMTYIDWHLLVPTILLMLFGVWPALWLIGRVPPTAAPGPKIRGWLLGAGFAALVALVSFAWLGDIMEARFAADIDEAVSARDRELASVAQVEAQHELPWRRFTTDDLTRETAAGRIVMVDFTADWCSNCKWLEFYVLNTPEVKALVEKHGIVPMIADWTKGAEAKDTDEMLRRIKAGGVPALAIFPPDRPNEPIYIPGMYSQGELIAKLKEAVGREPSAETARK